MTPEGSAGIWRSASVGLRAAAKPAQAKKAASRARGAMVKLDRTQEDAETREGRHLPGRLSPIYTLDGQQEQRHSAW
jgi:hypothetical protein